MLEFHYISLTVSGLKNEQILQEISLTAVPSVQEKKQKNKYCTVK